MKLGLIIGRFQPLHKGHVALIEHAQTSLHGTKSEHAQQYNKELF